MGAAIEKPLTFQAVSDEEARQRYSRISGSAEETEAHVALWRAIREGRLASVTDKVERILGRKPITLDQWMNENAGVFRGTADCAHPGLQGNRNAANRANSPFHAESGPQRKPPAAPRKSQPVFRLRGPADPRRSCGTLELTECLTSAPVGPNSFRTRFSAISAAGRCVRS